MNGKNDNFVPGGVARSEDSKNLANFAKLAVKACNIRFYDALRLNQGGAI